MAEAVEILREVRRRQRTGTGICLASDYIAAIDECIGKGGADRFFGLGTSRQWTEAYKDAQQKLVYRADAMTASNFRKGKKQEEASGITPGACMDFDCVLTSGRRDRDRDILDPDGAILDPSMPLLWQHIPMQPIGKMVGLLAQDKKSVQIRCAIVDNALGQDAAALVEFGALRISHGFVPVKWKAIEEEEEDQDGRGPYLPMGWHITEYHILEVSLVSIPSNIDAVITESSRGKLHSPLIKSWAKSLFDRRPALSKGAGKMAEDTTDLKSPVTVNINLDKSLLEKAKEEPPEDEEEDEEEEEEGADDDGKEEGDVSMASLGRVHLRLENLAAMEGLNDDHKKCIKAAMAELKACIVKYESAESGDDEEEEEEPPFADEDDPSKAVEGEDDVTPGDSVGRADEAPGADEPKSHDLASQIFADSLRKHQKAKAK